jgi:hypothetical protein
VTFEAAVMFVTWAAVAFLTIIVMHLHLRLQRLERMTAARPDGKAYSNFTGRHLDELIADAALQVRPRIVVALSGSCASCERVLNEIASPVWTLPTLIVWTDHAKPAMPPLPSTVMIAANGPALATRLGIRITPFALWADNNGVITKASPVNSLSSPGVPSNGGP